MCKGIYSPTKLDQYIKPMNTSFSTYNLQLPASIGVGRSCLYASNSWQKARMPACEAYGGSRMKNEGQALTTVMGSRGRDPQQ